MKICLTLCCLLMAFCSILNAHENPDTLAGKWKLLNEPGKWTVELNFEKSGSFSVQRFISAKYKYHLNGDTLISSLFAPQSDSITAIDTSFVTINSDTLLNSYYKEKVKYTKVMVRDGDYNTAKNKKNPLIGRWKWNYPTKELAIETFNNNGTWDLEIIGTKYTGDYKVNSDTLTMIYNNKKNTSLLHTFEIMGNLLKIRDLKTEKEYLYKKSD